MTTEKKKVQPQDDPFLGYPANYPCRSCGQTTGGAFKVGDQRCDNEPCVELKVWLRKHPEQKTNGIAINMPLWRVRIAWDLVVRAKASDDATCAALAAVQTQPFDDEPDITTPVPITDLIELPANWGGSCRPYGERDGRDRTIAELLSELNDTNPRCVECGNFILASDNKCNWPERLCGFCAAVCARLERSSPRVAAKEKPESIEQAACAKTLGEINAEREEILTAFIAKHGFEPDRVIQVIQKTATGYTYFMRRRTDEEMAAGAMASATL